jgi:hypothetical protein
MYDWEASICLTVIAAIWLMLNVALQIEYLLSYHLSPLTRYPYPLPTRKVALTLPDDILGRLDRMARDLGKSRSRFVSE